MIPSATTAETVCRNCLFRAEHPSKKFRALRSSWIERHGCPFEIGGLPRSSRSRLILFIAPIDFDDAFCRFRYAEEARHFRK